MTQTLDCTALMCPMPIVRVARAVKALNPGDTLEVTATDPAFEADIRAWCGKMKHELVEYTRRGEVFVAVIRKS